MTPRHQATRAAIDLIKRFEGFRASAAQLPDGRWTIGYGHTRTARAGKAVTEADADALLIYDVAAVVTAINEWVFSPLTQNQFDALVAFVFNVGLENFRRSSVLRRLNEGSHLQAACAMEMWRTADFEGERIVVDALVRRRSAEMALFLTPQDGYIAVPSLVVVPRVDEAVARGAPLASTEVRAPLDGAVAAVLRAEDAEPAPASRAAAEAITARLNAILAEHAAPEAAAPAADGEPPLAAPLPPVEDEPALGLRPRIAEDEPQAAGAAPDVEAESGESGEPHVVSVAAPLMFNARPVGAMRRPRQKSAPAPVLVLMGLTGLGVAGAGPFWGFSAHATARFPLVPDPEAAGLGVGLVGVGLLVSSVYLLLTRLAGRGD